MDEKAKRLAEIMDEEDVTRAERGEKPLYQDEETFYENHPDLI